MSEPTAAESLAKKRFLALSLIRLSGIVLIMVGLACALDRIDIPSARLIGVMLIVFGVIDAFLIPALFAKRWKSSDA